MKDWYLGFDLGHGFGAPDHGKSTGAMVGLYLHGELLGLLMKKRRMVGFGSDP